MKETLEMTGTKKVPYDIARLKKEGEKRFKELADSMPQLVWTARPDGTVDYYNNRYKEFKGLDLDPHTDTFQWLPMVHPDDAAKSAEAWNHSLKTGEIYQMEQRMQQVDGSFHWYLSMAIPVYNSEGKIIKWYGTSTNIDNVKNAQEACALSEHRYKKLAESLEDIVVARTTQIRELTKQLTLAEQRERQRLSQVLHDDLQQILFSIIMHFDLIEEKIKDIPTEIHDDLLKIKALTKKALQRSNTLALELNPPVLGGEGLDAALGWLSHFMEEHYGLKVDYAIGESFKEIPEDQRIFIVQLVRELLFNVIRHSGVNRVRLTARRSNRELVISVEDMGIGFNVDEQRSKIPQTGILGLARIEERLHLFGGRFEIESEIGKGTHATIIIPLPARHASLQKEGYEEKNNNNRGS